MAKTTKKTTPKTTPAKSSADHAEHHDQANHDHDHVGHDHDHHGHSHGQAPTHPLVAQSTMINFSIPWSTVEAEFKKIVNQYQPQVKAAGFRKGKVPAQVVIDTIGKQRLYEAVAERVIPVAYREAIIAGKYQPIASPEVHIELAEENQDWKFHAHIAEKPELKLDKYEAVVKKTAKDFDAEEKKSAKKSDKGEDSTKADANKPERSVEDRQLDAILKALIEKFEPKVPELLIRQDVQNQLDQLAQRLQQLNISFDKYRESLNKTEEQIQNEFATQSLMTWQLELLLAEIGNLIKAEVSEAEIDELFDKEPEGAKLKQDENQRAYVASILRKQKIFHHLQELASSL